MQHFRVHKICQIILRCEIRLSQLVDRLCDVKMFKVFSWCTHLENYRPKIQQKIQKFTKNFSKLWLNAHKFCNCFIFVTLLISQFILLFRFFFLLIFHLSWTSNISKTQKCTDFIKNSLLRSFTSFTFNDCIASIFFLPTFINAFEVNFISKLYKNQQKRKYIPKNTNKYNPHIKIRDIAAKINAESLCPSFLRWITILCTKAE